MKVTTKLSLAASLLVLLNCASFADNPPAPAAMPTAGSSSSTPSDISGNYSCKGTIVGSPDFTETVSLQKTGDTYKVTLTHNGDALPYNFGTGIFNKSVNNAFAYIYWDPKKPATNGAELFMIQPDGSLNGVFADSNTTTRNTEVCTKSSS